MTEPDFLFRDATEMAALVRTKSISPVEVVRAHIERIEAIDPTLNAIVTLDADGALAAARNAEDAVMSGAELGAFHGIPFTAKDALDSAGIATQRGSTIFAGRVPDRDATAIRRMKEAGAILLGKSNLPEFAFWTETDNPLSGRTNNPWDLERTPGGSSGGESAAIAAGLSPIGIGSDVGISVRGPSAHTGIVALKPTHGRIPATGHWPAVPRRFWHIGPMARRVRDVALAYSNMSGPDGMDGYATMPAHLDLGVSAGRRIRVGWLTTAFGPVTAEIAAAVERAAQTLADLGYEVEAVEIPDLAALDGVAVSGALFGAEVKPDFVRNTKGHEDQVADTVKAVLSSPDVDGNSYVAAHQTVERLNDAFMAYFQRYDVLLCPVTPIPATPHRAAQFDVDGVAMPARHILSATVPFNLTGLPAMTLRFGTSSNGLPLGIQLVSSWFAESTILHLAMRLEAVGGYAHLHPPI